MGAGREGGAGPLEPQETHSSFLTPRLSWLRGVTSAHTPTPHPLGPITLSPQFWLCGPSSVGPLETACPMQGVVRVEVPGCRIWSSEGQPGPGQRDRSRLLIVGAGPCKTDQSLTHTGFPQTGLQRCKAVTLEELPAPGGAPPCPSGHRFPAALSDALLLQDALGSLLPAQNVFPSSCPPA